MIHKLLLAGIIFLTVACRKQQDKAVFSPFIVADTLPMHGEVLSDSLLTGLVNDMALTDSCVLLSAYSEGYFLHCYDRYTGKPLAHLLAKGRGPGELMALAAFQINQEGVLNCFDPVAKVRHEYLLDSLLKNKAYQGKSYPLKNALRNVLPLGNIFLSGIGIGEDAGQYFRMIRLMKNDSVLCRYGDYPQAGRYTPLEMAMLYCFLGQWDIAPAGDRFAIVTPLGAILETFTITEDSIHPPHIHHFIEPVFEVQKNQIYPLPGQTVWGFHDIYVTNNYIYTLYSGHTHGLSAPTHIAVFDWQGNLVRFYRPGYRLLRICVDEQKNELYAAGFASDYETVIFKFRLAAP